MDTGAVSAIGIGPFLSGTAPQAVVSAVGAANTDIGFLVITGRGVPEESIGRVREAALEFFRMPADEKCHYVPEERWFFRGYEAVGGSALARTTGIDTPPDLCELFRISRFDDPAVARASGYQPGLEYFFAPNIWPEQPASHHQRVPELLPAAADSTFAGAAPTRCAY